jgi:hypothetical protein
MPTIPNGEAVDIIRRQELNEKVAIESLSL